MLRGRGDPCEASNVLIAGNFHLQIVLPPPARLGGETLWEIFKDRAVAWLWHPEVGRVLGGHAGLSLPRILALL